MPRSTLANSQNRQRHSTSIVHTYRETSRIEEKQSGSRRHIAASPYYRRTSDNHGRSQRSIPWQSFTITIWYITDAEPTVSYALPRTIVRSWAQVDAILKEFIGDTAAAKYMDLDKNELYRLQEFYDDYITCGLTGIICHEQEHFVQPVRTPSSLPFVQSVSTRPSCARTSACPDFGQSQMSQADNTSQSAPPSFWAYPGFKVEQEQIAELARVPPGSSSQLAWIDNFKAEGNADDVKTESDDDEDIFSQARGPSSQRGHLYCPASPAISKL